MKARIRIDKSLIDRAKVCARSAGYATVEEFVEHALERMVLDIEEPESATRVEQRLRGLGYIE